MRGRNERNPTPYSLLHGQKSAGLQTGQEYRGQSRVGVQRKGISLMNRRSIVAYTNRIRKQFEDMLRELVEIPTVSADPKHRKDIFHAANVARKFLKSFGAKTEIVPTPGNPVVLGRFEVRGAKKTVTVYNHLDVQPANEPEWQRRPFAFAKRDGKYFGRGSTDDKGPALTALFAARYASEAEIPVNIQFLWEAEEEIGSPHFEGFLKQKKNALKTDSIVVVDSVWISSKTPCIYYALRGGVTGSMILKTAKRDVHSGIAGGVAVNPILELCKVAAQCCQSDSGKVLIPGFYDGIVEPDHAEWRRLLGSGFHLKEWAKSYGLKQLQVKNRKEAMKRLWCRPTFDVNGIVGGYTGPGVKAAIPPRAELKFSCRLAPGQNPRKMAGLLEEHVKKINPHVKVIFHALLPPYLGSFSGPYARAAFNAFQYGFEKRPVFARAGGSDGAILLMQKHLKAPINLMGLSLPEHGYHAPNEYFDWAQARAGIQTFVKYFYEIAQL